MKPLPRLYTFADASFGDPVRLAEALLNAGARIIQVRNKRGSVRELLEQVERILSFAPRGVEIIVNDRVDVALISGAGGVHLGQDDVPPVEARRILGLDRMIGFSTHNLQQAMRAEKLPVDYVAVGPIFLTATKEKPDAVVGLENLSAICQAIRKPVVAIGGIKLENAEDVLKAGATSVAVISDVLSAPDVASRVQSWIERLNAFQAH
ncbi:MAG TPA: thiamine phosphate synthase [Terriglobia bacterium]|nr:thiamine phosphate synthase [Terriglobia bacterium]